MERSAVERVSRSDGPGRLLRRIYFVSCVRFLVGSSARSGGPTRACLVSCSLVSLGEVPRWSMPTTEEGSEEICVESRSSEEGPLGMPLGALAENPGEDVAGDALTPSVIISRSEIFIGSLSPSPGSYLVFCWEFHLFSAWRDPAELS